ncbi:MAG: DNA/RNA non-specific endonuclease [Pyrinomonadaceae bacterium]
MPQEVQEEQAIVARRHQRDFRLPSERGLTQPSATTTAEATLDAVVVVTSEPEKRGDLPTVEAVVPLTLAPGGRVPEVIQRDNDLRPMRFMHIGLLAARAVGRIRISDSPSTETGDATGFLIAPGLMMTNWHVLKTEDYAAAASIVFDDEDGIDGDPLETKSFRLRPDFLFVNDQTLDYAIVAVSPHTSSNIPLSQFGFLRLFKQTGKIDPTQRQAANIVQHPGGGPKKIALRDNYILPVVPDSVDPQMNEISVFYGTDTLKGSSGSPVCSDQWYVIALHRGGVADSAVIDGKRRVLRWDKTPAAEGDSSDMLRYLTNEGTRISRIYNSLQEKAEKENNAHAADALKRISAVATDPRTGPVSERTTPILLPGLPGGQGGAVEEITRRDIDKFADAAGYVPTFLGDEYPIPLPAMSSEVRRELATLKDTDETELKYANYSLMMNRVRRTAFFIAGNIDGGQHWKTLKLTALPKRPAWSWDPRMEDRFQPDDNIFSNAMQRGHLFKREDAVWGVDDDAMRLADEHSFTITNATPMIGDFNNKEWGDLEDIITREALAGNKLSYFAGPIFRSTDRFFNQLRQGVPASELRKGMRVPESFWKIVAWVNDEGLHAAGFILEQMDEIAKHGPIVEEIVFTGYEQKQAPIEDIERATGLSFAELSEVDTAG